jgi:hypothetical protein
MASFVRILAVILILCGEGMFLTTKHLVNGEHDAHPIFRFYDLPLNVRFTGLAMLAVGICLGLIAGKGE